MFAKTVLTKGLTMARTTGRANAFAISNTLSHSSTIIAPVAIKLVEPAWKTQNPNWKFEPKDFFKIDETSSNALSQIASSIKENVSDAAVFLAESYMAGHAEKVQRSEDMFKPIVDEIQRKGIEISQMSSKQQLEMLQALSGVRDEHDDNKSDIKSTKSKLSMVKSFIDSQFATVLKERIDPATLATMVKTLQTSTNVATKALKVLPGLNVVNTIHQAASVLYPEETKQLESYVQNRLEQFLESAQAKITTKINEGRPALRSLPNTANIIQTTIQSLGNRTGEIKQDVIDEKQSNSQLPKLSSF